MTELPEIVVTPQGNNTRGANIPVWDWGGGAPGPTQQSGGGWGGFADSFPTPAGYPAGTPLNSYFGGGGSGSASRGGLVPAQEAHYYSGYWAGVQGALYGFGPPAAPPIHSFGFATDVIERIIAPRTSDQPNSRQATFSAFGDRHIGNLIGLWLTPTPGSWSFGNNADEWPADLPDWGAPSPFNPIKGGLSDFSTALKRSPQLVNPELGAGELDPSNFVGPFDVEKLIYDPIRRMTDTVASEIGHTGSFPSVATPGNIISDVTPDNMSYIFPGDPNNTAGLLSPFHGPTTSFILLDW